MSVTAATTHAAIARKKKRQSGRQHPLRQLASALVAASRVTADALAGIEAEGRAELDDAVEFARHSPDATPVQALEEVHTPSAEWLGVSS